VSALSCISNPKTVRPTQRILKGLAQSVSLIKDGAKRMANVVG
jgi:hypothetical protein